jgi:phosphoribosylformylglycinamidine synthase
MAAKIPVVSPMETSTVSLMAYGFDPRVGQWSPWHGAQISVLSSLTKIACMGGKPTDCRLSFQEFFGRAVNEKAWGYPAAALLGSIDAQNAMGTASIGGKDSMSGTFEELNVPHTLVSFAVTHDEVENVTSGSFKKAGSNVYLVTVPYSEELAPDFDAFTKNTNVLYNLNASGKIAAMYPVCAGGIAEAVTKMAMGNKVGVTISNVPYSATTAGFRKDGRYSVKDLFTAQYGAIIVEANDGFETTDFVDGTIVKIGETNNSTDIKVEADNVPGMKISIADAEKAWESKLAKVFPPVSGAELQPELPAFAKETHKSLSEVRKNPVFNTTSAKPKILIPVFPGTNCEYDMARAFNLAGGDTKIFVFRNNTPQALAESLEEMQKLLKETQILALAGGFSAGDEPDGSGKFIANVIREQRIADEVMNLLKNRDGLVLGICNGFQALIKTGLVPYGEIKGPSEEMPTLTFNKIGRHISRVVRTRMVSATSPWAMDPSVVDPRVHLVPVSHGEGRIVIDKPFAEKLFANGQIFTQYVDENGNPSIVEPDNPNGSMYAIEGMTSPDGRVLGKMGHSERTVGIDMNGASRDLIKNVAGDPLTNQNENSCQNIFAAGVRYFK